MSMSRLISQSNIICSSNIWCVFDDNDYKLWTLKGPNLEKHLCLKHSQLKVII